MGTTEHEMSNAQIGDLYRLLYNARNDESTRFWNVFYVMALVNAGLWAFLANAKTPSAALYIVASLGCIACVFWSGLLRRLLNWCRWWDWKMAVVERAYFEQLGLSRDPKFTLMEQPTRTEELRAYLDGLRRSKPILPKWLPKWLSVALNYLKDLLKGKPTADTTKENDGNHDKRWPAPGKLAAISQWIMPRGLEADVTIPRSAGKVSSFDVGG